MVQLPDGMGIGAFYVDSHSPVSTLHIVQDREPGGGRTSRWMHFEHSFKAANRDQAHWDSHSIGRHFDTLGVDLLVENRLSAMIHSGIDFLHYTPFVHEVKMEDKFKRSLPRVAQICGMTKLRASTKAELISSNGRTEIEIGMDNSELTLKLNADPKTLTAQAVTGPLSADFDKLAQDVDQVKARWKGYFDLAKKGDKVAIHFLTEGQWALGLREILSDKILNDADIKSSEEKKALALQMIDQIDAFMGTRYPNKTDLQLVYWLGARRGGAIAGEAINYVWSHPERPFGDYIKRHIEQKKDIKDFGGFMKKKVDDAIIEPPSQFGTLTIKDPQFWIQNEYGFLNKIDSAFTYSRVGWALENRTQVACMDAARRHDLHPAFYWYFQHMAPDDMVVVDKKDPRIIHIDAREGGSRGLELAFDKVGEILEQLSTYAQSDFTLRLPYYEVNWPIDDVKKVLVKQSDIGVKRTPLHHAEDMKAMMKEIQDEGRGYFYLHAPTGWGKTAIMAELIENLAHTGISTEGEVEVYTLPDEYKTPQNLIKALKYMILLMSENKHVALVIDDIHKIEDQMTDKDMNDYLDALILFRKSSEGVMAAKSGDAASMADLLSGKGGAFFIGELPPPVSAIGAGHRLRQKNMVTYTDKYADNYREVAGFVIAQMDKFKLNPKLYPNYTAEKHKQIVQVLQSGFGNILKFYAEAVTAGAVTDAEFQQFITNEQENGLATTKGRVELSQFLSPGWMIDNDLKVRLHQLNTGVSLETIKKDIWRAANRQVQIGRSEYDRRIMARQARGMNLAEATSPMAERPFKKLSSKDQASIAKSAAAEVSKTVGSIIAKEVRAAIAPVLMQIAMLYSDADVMRTLLLASGDVSELLPLPEDRLARLVSGAEYTKGRTMKQEFETRAKRYTRKASWDDVEYPLINREDSFSREYWEMPRGKDQHPSRVMGITIAVLESMGFTVTKEDLPRIQPLVQKIVNLGGKTGYTSGKSNVNMLRFTADCIRVALA